MEITVGVDVSKGRLDVHVEPLGESFALGNDAAGVAALVARLGQLEGLIGIGIEASGRYERLAVAELAAAALPVVVLNPALVRHYAQAIGFKAKTDPIDARLIALFVAAVRPEPRPLADAQTQDLAALMARRRQLVEMLGAERARRMKTQPGRVRSSLARVVTTLEDDLKALDADIDHMVRSTPSGAPTRTCSLPSPASARSSPGPCSPNCPNSEPSAPGRSPPSPVSPPSLASREIGAAAASSAAAAPPLEPPCSWAPSSPPVTTRSSRPSTTA
jgi:hypothetical protein